jgi:hypothetical protein
MQFQTSSGKRRPTILAARRRCHRNGTVAAGLSTAPHMPPMGQYCWPCSRRPRFPPGWSQSHSRSASTAPGPPARSSRRAAGSGALSRVPPAVQRAPLSRRRARALPDRALPRGQARWSVYPRDLLPLRVVPRVVTGARPGGVTHVVAPARERWASNARQYFISSDAQRSNWRSLQVHSTGNASRRGAPGASM